MTDLSSIEVSVLGLREVQELRAAGEALSSALKNYPCRCVYNVPYADGQVKREVTHACARCRSIKRWELANGRFLSAEVPV